MKTKQIYLSFIVGITGVLAVMTIFFAQNVVNQKQETQTQATVLDREVKLSFFPKKQISNVGDTISVAVKAVATTQKKVASMVLQVKFDTSHLQLNPIDLNKKADGMNLLKVTLLEKANSEGIVKLLFGAESENTAPQGVVNIPSFSFQVIKNARSTVSVTEENSQIIFVEGVNAEVQVEDEAVVDSTIQIPTATTTQKPNPTISIPVSSPTPKPSLTVQPSPTTIVVISPSVIAAPSIPVGTNENQPK